MNALYSALPISGQNLACTWAGYRRSRERFNRHFHTSLARWEQSVGSTICELHALQWSRLTALVERARRFVPHFRRMDLPSPCDVGDPGESIARTLATLPVLEKAEYSGSPEAFIAEDIPGRRLRRGKTSGTTGTALPLWYTPEALAEEYATVWRLRRSCGVDLTAPHLSFGGQIIVPFHQSKPPFWRRNFWGRQVLFSLYHMKPEHLDAYIDAIHALPARYVQGYPSSLHLVGRAMLDAGRPLPQGRLAAVFTSSESLLAFHRDTIERAFGAPIRDRYGTSELCVSMTACADNRLHVDMEFGIVEVEAQEEGSDWVRGPLLVTGFGNDATPFLRYRIGDVGTRLKSPCSCGRPGDAFLDVDGRIEDYVATPDGRLVGRLDHIFKEQRAIAEAQILQEARDSIAIHLVPKPGWGAESERALCKEIRTRLGDEIGIEIRLVELIPREANGKFRAVKSAVAVISG